MKRLLCLLAACGGAQAVAPSDPTPGPAGSLGKLCGGVSYYVSSGNDKGTCHAQVDDRTFTLVSMACDDGAGNASALACKDGRVTCKAKGTGLCAADERAVKPAMTTEVTIDYFAHRCGQATYVIAVPKGTCQGSFDRATGSRAMHCDDGAGDTADFTCRDGDGACAFTGSGVCGTDEALVRKPAAKPQ